LNIFISSIFQPVRNYCC